MARKSRSRKKGRGSSRKRSSGGSGRFVLKTEGLCKCATPRGATFPPLARRMATVCKRDPHSYIVDSRAKNPLDRVVMKCTDVKRRKLAAMPPGAQLPLFGGRR
jgi:hypothetical protein